MAARNGIDQKDIAGILREVASYIRQKDIGAEHNELVDEWLSRKKPSAAEWEDFSALQKKYTEDQEDSEAYKGLSKNAKTLVKTYGYPNIIETVPDKSFDYFLKGDAPKSSIADGAGYWPGKLVPTLAEFMDELYFFSQREALEQKPPAAQALIRKIDSFKGASGNCHCAITQTMHEWFAYVDKTERHPSETFVRSAQPSVDLLNCMNFTYDWMHNKWLPAGKNAVGARLNISGNGDKYFSKSEELSRFEATIAEGLRISGIKACVEGAFGKTYGEDAIVITMDTKNFARYLDIVRGVEKIDLTEEQDRRIVEPYVREDYNGYEPGKAAFYGPGGVYVLSRYISAAQDISANDAQLIAYGNIRWLRATGIVAEEKVKLPVGNGKVEYTKFSRMSVDWSRTYKVGREKMDGRVLSNEVCSRLSTLVDTISPSKPQASASRKAKKPAHRL